MFAINSDFIDLHIHSTISDGISSPVQIIKKIYNLKLKVFSLTDHDTIEGVNEVYKLGVPRKIKFISGIEMHADLPKEINNNSTVHIIGYGVNIKNISLLSYLKNVQKERKIRSKKIINKLNKIGIVIKESDLIHDSKNLVIGRPHFAKVMIKKGIVKSFTEAFDIYLGTGKIAYVKKKKKRIKKVIEIIKNANGIPILAHPYLLKITNLKKIENLIKNLVKIGIKGIECIHPKHSKLISRYYSKISSKFGIIITGGSDFHTNKDLFAFSFNNNKKNFCIFFNLLINKKN